MGTCRLLALLLLCGACSGKETLPRPLPLRAVAPDRTYLRDGYGRYVHLHGVNVSGSSKNPASISPAGVPTYVGKPFVEKDARGHFERIRALGFNSIRLLVAWEGVEPVRRGEYDQEYLRYLREMVRLAHEYGLYVLVDMHQDMYSRHLAVKYNERPAFGTPGSVENSLLALVKPYTDEVRGDGAPRWAVEACLQEKDMSSKWWGTPRVLSGLSEAELRNIYDVYAKLTGLPNDPNGPLPEWVVHFAVGMPDNFAVNESTDMLPFTNWTLATALSLDIARNYACLFAGDKVFPKLSKDGQNIKDYLQSAYAGAFAQVALQVKDEPNVLGYDLMNEPSGNFLTLTVGAALIKSGLPDSARQYLIDAFGQDTGAKLYQAIVALRLLPPDTKPETLRLWGLDQLDVGAALALNSGFDDAYLRPFYERIGQAILEVDPDATVWIEGTLNITNILSGPTGGGVGGTFNITMTAPRGLPNLVYAPHWYPDIYPFPGFNAEPRKFSPEQVRHRDFRSKLEETQGLSAFSLGNVPTVFGEFGSYFNFNGIKDSRDTGYEVTAQILDNYYESFEQMLQGNMLWCLSPENKYLAGDGWNHEDFSVLDPGLRPRAQAAWNRPHARLLAGKPLSTHFYSDFHYFDPDKGVVNPTREFEVRYASKESEAPTEITVPTFQYPDGFFVWVSDGQCFYDHSTQTLYHFPATDEPATEHWVRIRPPLPGQTNVDHRYFFKGDLMVSRGF